MNRLNKEHTVESPCFGMSRDILRKHRIIAGLDSSEYVDAYKVLRTRVIQKMRENGWRTLAVTSPNTKAGTTVCAINLSIGLALEVNQTVLLVDANLRNPSIHKYLGITPKYCLADYLVDNIPIHDLIINPTAFDQLRILTGNRPLLDSAEMLSSPRMTLLAESLKNHDASRLIVYDLPNLQTADSLAFIPLADAVLLVIEAGSTTEEELARAFEHLHGMQVIGTVLNKFK